jgi:hypothetical protein
VARSTLVSLSYIVRAETYGELTYGAPVKIVGERGRWSFRHHCVNTDTGSEWLDVFGGEPGTETLRAFRIDRVVLIRPKGYRKPRQPQPAPSLTLTLEDLL